MATSSVLSFPNRGHWGDRNYRGNCSGHLYRNLYEILQPRTVIDPCCGSGTSIEVADEMGIRAVGLDLRFGFNLLRDSIAEAAGFRADLNISHPPYHDMIVYSGEMYEEVFADDLSRCGSVEEFLEKSQQMLLNQRDATCDGGYYATIIGDQRKNGEYVSYQAEFIARMPRSELKSVMIKMQHNCWSDRQSYASSRVQLPHIKHEYILIWQKPGRVTSYLCALSVIAREAQARVRGTWRSVVRQAVVSLGGEVELSSLYARIAENAPERLKQNEHWKAKVRQTLQLHPDLFQNVERGCWSLAA